MYEDRDFNPADAGDLARWRAQLAFEADAMLIDPGRALMDRYVAANPGPLYTQAITVLLDRALRIRFVGGTYDEDHANTLEVVQMLVSEAN